MRIRADRRRDREELLRALNAAADERSKKLKAWPDAGRELSGALRKARPQPARRRRSTVDFPPARDEPDGRSDRSGLRSTVTTVTIVNGARQYRITGIIVIRRENGGNDGIFRQYRITIDDRYDRGDDR